MPSLSEIRAALKSTLTDAIPDIHGYSRVPEVTNLPAFVVVPRTSEFQLAMGRGMDAWNFDVIVLCSRRDDELAQDDLDEYVNGFGDKSVREAVWNARSLGLADVEAIVTGMTDYGARFEIGNLDHVGARIQVRVITTGTS